jgi:phage tail sheath protein FI
MTDRQAKALTLREALKVQVLMNTIAERMAEIAQGYVFQPVTPALAERFCAQIDLALDKAIPGARVESIELVHDSISFDLVYDRRPGQKYNIVLSP